MEQSKLALDEDVNARLVTWKVPANEFTKEKKVTLRGLLSHTSGLTVHGFPGYATDDPVPTVVQILDGREAGEHEADPGGFRAGHQVALFRRRLYGDAADDRRRHRAQAVPAVYAGSRAGAARDEG